MAITVNSTQVSVFIDDMLADHAFWTDILDIHPSPADPADVTNFFEVTFANVRIGFVKRRTAPVALDDAALATAALDGQTRSFRAINLRVPSNELATLAAQIALLDPAGTGTIAALNTDYTFDEMADPKNIIFTLPSTTKIKIIR